MTHRIFLDDLEKALIVFANDPSIDVIHPKDPKKLDSLVVQYVKNHFAIAINQKGMFPQYLGSEIKDDVMVVYAEILDIPTLDHIKISNDVLIDFYPDQMNLIHVQKMDKTKSIRLSKSQSTDTIQFE